MQPAAAAAAAAPPQAHIPQQPLQAPAPPAQQPQLPQQPQPVVFFLFHLFIRRVILLILLNHIAQPVFITCFHRVHFIFSICASFASKFSVARLAQASRPCHRVLASQVKVT
jgi:hypothetical protein